MQDDGMQNTFGMGDACANSMKMDSRHVYLRGRGHQQTHSGQGHRLHHTATKVRQNKQGKLAMKVRLSESQSLACALSARKQSVRRSSQRNLHLRPNPALVECKLSAKSPCNITEINPCL